MAKGLEGYPVDPRVFQLMRNSSSLLDKMVPMVIKSHVGSGEHSVTVVHACPQSTQRSYMECLLLVTTTANSVVIINSGVIKNGGNSGISG